MVNFRDSLDASQSHAIEIHLQTELQDDRWNTARVGNIPGTDDHSACICSTACLDDDRSCTVALHLGHCITEKESCTDSSILPEKHYPFSNTLIRFTIAAKVLPIATNFIFANIEGNSYPIFVRLCPHQSLIPKLENNRLFVAGNPV